MRGYSRRSEPTLLADLIGRDELRIRLREVDDALDETDQTSYAARHNRDQDTNDSASDITKDETVNA